jgi:nickel-dependent lactate racemase
MIWPSGPFEPIAITYSGGHKTATIDEFRDELGETLLVMRVHQGS